MNKYQESLNFLCDHAMVYKEDYDWEENECGEYWELDDEELEQYKTPLQELVDKAIPKKPHHFVHERYTRYYCPKCSKRLKKSWSVCPICATRIDWSDEE